MSAAPSVFAADKIEAVVAPKQPKVVVSADKGEKVVSTEKELKQGILKVQKNKEITKPLPEVKKSTGGLGLQSEYESSADCYIYPEGKDLTQDTNGIVPMASGSGSINEAMFDDSYSFKISTTCYWERGSYGTVDTYKLTKVKGGYSQHDYTLKPTRQWVAYGVQGSSGNNGKLYSKKIQQYPAHTNKSWSYTAPSSWHSIQKKGGYYVGAFHQLRFKRSKGEMEVNQVCMVIGSEFWPF